MLKKVALSIAGSDPSSGAGIQADLKSFSYLKIHGATVITCITSQNTHKVGKIHRVPLEIIEDQIDLLYEDFQINSVKTGMLYDEQVIKLISKKIDEYNISPIVDPVMVATSGDFLINEDYIKSFKKNILPKTYILTANIPEAKALTECQIKSVDDVKNICKKLYDFGPKYVLIKGGHLKTIDAIDVFYDGKRFYEFNLPMIKDHKAHGSGCSLSAVITGLIALGDSPVNAVKKAKYIIWSMINEGYILGKGADVLNHFCRNILPLDISDKKIDIWNDLRESIDELVLFLPKDFIAEVGMDFAFAIENAKTFEDICAIDGRLYKTKDGIDYSDVINFCVSRHISKIILAAMTFDRSVRCAINISYSEKNLSLCKNAGLKIGFFDRKKEPLKTESTMEWGTKNAISKLGYVPDVIYDLGSVGKEPMIRILGKNPKDVLLKIKKMLNFAIR